MQHNPHSQTLVQKENTVNHHKQISQTTSPYSKITLISKILKTKLNLTSNPNPNPNPNPDPGVEKLIDS